MFSSMNSPTPMRYLLDTNVFLDLADGAISEYEAQLVEMSMPRTPPVLYTCDIVVQELAKHLLVESEFARYRTAFDWMDRLCGNHGLAELFPMPIRQAIHVTPLEMPHEIWVGVNKLRRAVINSSAFDDLGQRERDTVHKISDEIDRQEQDWVQRWEKAYRKHLAGDGAKPKVMDPPHKIVNSSVETMIECWREPLEKFGQTRADDEIRKSLREFLHAHAGLLFKIATPSGYNFSKHSNDCHDVFILTYCALGYRVVTRDSKMLAAVEHGKCREARCCDLETMLDEYFG